jgi:hypothetical protein
VTPSQPHLNDIVACCRDVTDSIDGFIHAVTVSNGGFLVVETFR